MALFLSAGERWGSKRKITKVGLDATKKNSHQLVVSLDLVIEYMEFAFYSTEIRSEKTPTKLLTKPRQPNNMGHEILNYFKPIKPAKFHIFSISLSFILYSV